MSPPRSSVTRSSSSPPGRGRASDSPGSRGATDFAIPAEIPSEAASRVEETALTVYEVLGCSGFARVDTIFAGGIPWILDVKTIPGFTETSTFPLAAETAGTTFETLVETILEAALRTEAAAKL